MVYNLYSIFDKDAEEFGPLFNAKNAVIASRYVEQMLEEVKNVDPYALYCMGEYDTESGIVNTKVDFVSDCSDLVDSIYESDKPINKPIKESDV